MRNAAGVVECVGVGPYSGRPANVGIGLRAGRTLWVACVPEFLKPADVPKFPERWIQCVSLRDDQTFERAFENSKSTQSVLPTGLQRRRQCDRACVAGRLCVLGRWHCQGNLAV